MKIIVFLISAIMILSAMPFPLQKSAADATDNPDFVIEGDGVLIEYRGKGGDVVIPESVKRIEGAFRNNDTITSCEITQNVIEIGTGSFSDCDALISITGCENLAVIEASAFESCELLNSFVFTKSLHSIGSHAFTDCESIHIADLCGVVSLGGAAFRDCSNLEQVILCDYLKEIPDWAFGYCRNLSSIELPEGLVSIGEYAFINCERLQSVELPNSLKYVERAFVGTPFAENLKYGDTWVIGGDGILLRYNGCEAHVIIPDGIKAIADAFEGHAEIETIEMGDDVETICACAFLGCTSIRELIVGKSVTRIGDSAISSCTALETVTFPRGLKILETNTFGDLKALKTLVFEGPKPENVGHLGCSAGESVQREIYVDYNGFFTDSWAPNGETMWQDFYLTSTFSFDPSRPRPNESIEPKMRGDVNGDGKITSADAALILRYVVYLVGLNSRQLEAARLTGNEVTAADAAVILRYIVNLIQDLPN